MKDAPLAIIGLVVVTFSVLTESGHIYNIATNTVINACIRIQCIVNRHEKA